MRKYIYMAVAAIAALSSCDKTNSIIDGGQEKTVNAPVFTATIEPTTKTTLGLNSETGNYTKINWDINDEVKIDFCTSNKSDFIQAIYQATPGADATTATLSLKAGEVLDPQCDRICQAIYPASMNQYYDIIFPATQYYEGDGKLTNAPMLYYNSNLSVIPTTLTFKNAAAVLAITVPYSQMTSVKSITVSSDLVMNGKAEFSPATGILHYLKGKAVDASNSKITLDCYTKAGANVQIPEGGSKTFYISILPLSNKIDGYSWMLQSPYYNYLKIDVTDGTTTRTMRTKDGVNITIDRNTIYPFTFNGKLVPAADPNLLTGEFSVSATKKVKFTKGNLQATYHSSTSSYTWGFATHQYDYIGNAAGNSTITASGTNNDGAVVDLFGWSTNATYYGINASGFTSVYYGDFKDWGGLFPENEYFTLSISEWEYLLFTRSYTNRYAKARVENKCGLLIFPDNYNGSSTVTGTGIANVNTGNASYPESSIPTDDWASMESAGVVFLPFGGIRSNGSSFLTDADGYYWSSTKYDKDYPSIMYFDSSYVTTGTGTISWGLHVRLVKAVSE